MRNICVIAALTALAIIAYAQQPAQPARDHPAILYSTRSTADPIAQLNRRLQQGVAELSFMSPQTYLESVLRALNIPIESQVLVFSKTSSQSGLIAPMTPRAIYFNDNVFVSAVPRSARLEIAAVDPQQGVIFYTLAPAGDLPQFRRDNECLRCHQSSPTLDVPGLAVGSVQTDPDGSPAADGSTTISDHRSPFAERWGGWYVTGVAENMRHMGKSTPSDSRFLPGFGLSSHSDIVALMVLEHQTHMTNLLTRFGWQTRIAVHNRESLPSPNELVDYLLFVDEPALPGKIQGTSGFVEKFSSLGPRDSKNRSFRQFDLSRRLFLHPCSYMIYTEAFDALPGPAKEAIYKRMWVILSGEEKDKKYESLSPTDRQAIIEILRATKKDLPDYFKQPY